MGVTTELRREIKTRFLPMVAAQGFTIEEHNLPLSMEFRRSIGANMQIFGIQWEKYGRPRFLVIFGTCPHSGVRVLGQDIEPHTALPSWLPDSGSLQPERGAFSRAWFRQDLPLLRRPVSRQSLRPASVVVDELLELFPELGEYWRSGAIGPHMRQWRLHKSEIAA